MENTQGKKLLARYQLRRFRFKLTRSTIEHQIDEILPTLIVLFLNFLICILLLRSMMVVDRQRSILSSNEDVNLPVRFDMDKIFKLPEFSF